MQESTRKVRPPTNARVVLLYALLILCYVVAGMHFRFTHSVHGDAGALVRSTRRLVDGSLAIYAERGSHEFSPPHGLSTGYPPLFAIVFAPFVAFSDRQGYSEGFAAMLIGLPMLLFDAFSVLALRRLARQRCPGVNEASFLFASTVLLFAGGFYFASWVIGHPEGMTTCFLLMGLSYLSGNPTIAGILLGAGFLSKQTAVFVLLPTFLALINHRPLMAQTAIAAAGIIAIVFAPFLIAHPHQAYYALFVAEQNRVIGGANLWHVASYLSHQTIPEDIYQSLRAMMIRCANGSLVVSVGLVNLFALRWPLQLHSVRFYALVAASCMLTLFLGKWVEAHYYALPLTFVFAWDIIRRDGKMPWTAISVALLIRIGYMLPKPGIHPFSSAVLILTVVGCLVLLLKDAFKPEPPNNA